MLLLFRLKERVLIIFDKYASRKIFDQRRRNLTVNEHYLEQLFQLMEDRFRNERYQENVRRWFE